MLTRTESEAIAEAVERAMAYGVRADGQPLTEADLLALYAIVRGERPAQQ